MIIDSLPAQSTPFIGRTSELAEIRRLYADPACRLLTLVGPGGMGKTRLAMEAAQLLAAPTPAPPLFPDGVYFVPLAPVSTTDFIISAVADALGFSFFQNGDFHQQLLTYLGEKTLLLVLDNFEHLLAGVGIVSELLEAAPDVCILATSRERLNLLEEWVLEIHGLSFPAPDSDDDIETYNAVQLFVQHAQRVQVGFELTDAVKPAVSRICRLVGGMPLGIELAASWVRVLPCEDIADEIEHGLDFLETPARNVPLRHRSMRAVLDHSWSLLSEAEQDAYKTLAVFRGGFTRDAAKAVAGASLRMLSALADKSLLRHDADGRYHLHELLRQYGQERLAESDQESQAAYQRHATYYADLMHQKGALLHTREQRAALAEIEAEIENVRTAWHYLVAHHCTNRINRCIKELGHYYQLRYRDQDAMDLFKLAIDNLHISDLAEDQQVLGRLLVAYGRFEGYCVSESGVETVHQGLAILRRHGDPEDLATALEALLPALITMHGWTELIQPDDWDWTPTLQAAHEGLEIARENGLTALTAYFLYWLSWVAFLQHDYDTAWRLGEESLALAESADHPYLTGLVSGPLLGRFAEVLGKLDKAKQLRQQSNRVLEESGRFLEVGWNHAGLGYIAYLEQNYAEARQRYRETLQICTRISDRGYRFSQVLQHLGNIARIMAAEGQVEQAIDLVMLVQQHRNSSKEALIWAEGLHSELAAGLPPETLAAARERTRDVDVDAVVRELLANWGTNHTESPSSPDAADSVDALTEREVEILALIADGLSNREIADRLVFALGTVKWYINQIYGKLHVRSRTQAVARARAMGLID